jgi:hypothetical protein
MENFSRWRKYIYLHTYNIPRILNGAAAVVVKPAYLDRGSQTVLQTTTSQPKGVHSPVRTFGIFFIFLKSSPMAYLFVYL